MKRLTFGRYSGAALCALALTIAFAVHASTPPVAVADVYPTPSNGVLSIAAPGVLANDTDPGGLSLTAVLDSTTSNGVLALNQNGSFTYTPSSGFLGTDSFKYHALDSGGQFSSSVTVSLPIGTRWHLTIPFTGTYKVPSGFIYTPVFAVATFGDSYATLDFMEITDTDDQAGGRDYDCMAILHTSATMDKTTNSGKAGAGQIGRNTSGYPDIMTFYAKYDFETATFSTSTPGVATFIVEGRKTFAFDSTETLYAECYFNRGDGHPGPLISNLSILADITSVQMPGAVMLSSSQNTGWLSGCCRSPLCGVVFNQSHFLPVSHDPILTGCLRGKAFRKLAISRRKLSRAWC